MATHQIHLIVTSLACLLLAGCQSTSVSQSVHPTPEAAFSALTTALKADDFAGVERLTGLKLGGRITDWWVSQERKAAAKAAMAAE